MLIETTMHVNTAILEMLQIRAEMTGRTITSIVRLLMQRVMDDNQKMLGTSSRIRYQKRDEKENWQRLHIVLNEYEYEYYLDMRKFYKMSVSYILAYAVLRYLEELLEGNSSTDNYCYKNYILIRKTIDETVTWQIYWGIPPQLTDL